MATPEGPSNDPRVRAAQTKRDRTRRSLLDAADRLFGSRGWARTRVEDVAADAGVSAATAYNHFPTKHELVAHVYQPILAPLRELATRDLDSGRPVVDAVHDQVLALVRMTARNRTLTAAFWSAVEEHTARMRELPDISDPSDPRVITPIPDALTMLLQHGQETGVLRSYPPAPEVAGLVVNMVLTRSVNRPRENPDELAELLLTVIFGMLKPELLSAERPFRIGG